MVLRNQHDDGHAKDAKDAPELLMVLDTFPILTEREHESECSDARKGEPMIRRAYCGP